MTAFTDLPRLHVVTDDGVLAAPGFAERAHALVAAFGSRIVLQLRSRTTSGAQLHELARRLSEVENAVILVNDRVDVALTARAAGVQLRRDSILVSAARELLGDSAWIGYSAHEAMEGAAAVVAGADFVVAGTIYPSASHRDAPPRGVEFVTSVAHAVRMPVIAIGGITKERVRECSDAGAFGVAVISAVWSAADPIDAAGLLLAELED